MKIGFTSTAALNNVPRLTTLRIQTELFRAQKELQTQRHADVGLALGFDAGQAVALRVERVRLDEIKVSNDLASVRLDTTQNALNELSKTATDIIGQLFGSRNSTTGPAAVKNTAAAALQSLGDILNTSLNGTFLFAGINTDVKPVANYFGTPPSVARVAIEAEFTATFGFPQSDPQVAGISGTDMQAFLDTQFADRFTAANWAADWSSASD